MKTIEMKLYTFDELSEQARETAINDHRYINTEFNWWECTYDTWEEMGVQIEHFDLYKQDIGLEFYETEEEVAKHIVIEFGHNEFYDFAKEYLEEKKKIVKTYEDSFDEFGECEDYDFELEELNDRFHNDLKEAILFWLQSELEYLESDEAIADILEAHEYDFTRQGKRFHL